MKGVWMPRPVWMSLPLVCLLLLPLGALAQETEPPKDPEYKWTVTLFSGLWSGNNMGDVFKFEAHHTNNSWILGLGLNRQILQLSDDLTSEVEFNLAKHFDHTTHWDLTALAILRWHLFPWSGYMRTSLAAGWGLSYATNSHHAQWSTVSDPGYLHHYLLFELTLGLPAYKRWDLSFRLHHRSPGLSTLGKGISNYAAVGIGYNF